MPTSLLRQAIRQLLVASFMGSALIAGGLGLTPLPTTSTAYAMNGYDEAAARATIETLAADLAKLAQQTKDTPVSEAIAAAEDIVRKNFNLDAIAAATVGQATFAKWDDAQQANYVEAFTRYTLATQRGMLTRYEQGRLDIEQVVKAPGDLAMVRTRYQPLSGKASTVDFMLRKNDQAQGQGRYQIVDLIVDGAISQLKVRRAEFSSVLNAKGYDGLVTILRKKTEQILAKKG